MAITWKKPNGTIIETNDRDETIAHCESLSWERVTVTYETQAEPDNNPDT